MYGARAPDIVLLGIFAISLLRVGKLSYTQRRDNNIIVVRSTAPRSAIHVHGRPAAPRNYITPRDRPPEIRTATSCTGRCLDRFMAFRRGRKNAAQHFYTGLQCDKDLHVAVFVRAKLWSRAILYDRVLNWSGSDFFLSSVSLKIYDFCPPEIIVFCGQRTTAFRSLDFFGVFHFENFPVTIGMCLL